MNAMVNQAEMSVVQGGAARRRRLASRALALVAAVGLLGLLTGDGRAVAFIQGIDPLDVLNLKVRPNVILVLDSSGSMTNNLAETLSMGNGDHPRSKLRQAKEVLNTVVQANERKVSFLYGQYTQKSSVMQQTGAGTDRFRYSTNGFISSTMPTTELQVLGEPGFLGSARGLQSWQDIRAGWNTLYFGERVGVTTVTCTATVTAQFYRTGAALATALTTAMNAALTTPACSASRAAAGVNIYTVSYTGASGSFTFSRTAGTRNFQILWAGSPNSIRGALGSAATGNTALGTGNVTSGNSYMMLFRNTGSKFTETFDPDGAGPAASQAVITYNMRAGRLFNGETISVQADGTICDMTNLYPTGTLTSPASFFLQEVAAGCGGPVPAKPPVKFDFSGSDFGGNGVSCYGFAEKVQLIPCDLDSPPAATQLTNIFPFIDLEFNFNTDGTPKGNYVESTDGAFRATSIPTDLQGGGKADGSTPIGNVLIDLKGTATGATNCLNAAGTPVACPVRGFTKLWTTGQAGSASSSGPAPYQLDPISTHVDPKEKTIVLFVTDGDDTCPNHTAGGAATDNNALRAAHKAELLFNEITVGQPASSVQTFMIGYGGAFTAGVPTRLNWIAWGGSGMKSDGTYSFGTTGAGEATQWSAIPTAGDRARCTTCTDAYVAPDGETLRKQLQSIIDQGASIGEFSAASGGASASITESVFEYVDLVAKVKPTDDAFSPNNPNNRYGGEVPTRYLASFSLPGFKGQLKAYQNDGAGNAVLKWDAGTMLFNKVSTGMITACPTLAANSPAVLGQCVFGQLHGGATESTIWSSAAAIKRRIYTTSQNGYFGVTTSQLITTPSPISPFRMSLWPPQTTSGVVAPPNYTAIGLFDQEMGLPLDTFTAPATATTELATLQTNFHACLGGNLPAGCTSATVLTKMKAARREAREIILAFMAGATPVLDLGANPLRVAGGTNANQIIYKAKAWMLSESTLATAAVISPPFPRTDKEPLVDLPEWRLYRDGVRVGGKNTGSGAQITQGFGLSHPDDDGTAIPGAIPEDSRTTLKPVMTVVYTGANDMLHAFRAGPSCATTAGTCTEYGGQELWGFVPYDQLVKLRDRYRDFPESKATKNYMIASSLRFADVFVPGPIGSPSVGGVPVPAITGVWRKILFFGRGIGGKYLTALDVTAPGPYTLDNALKTTPPIPLWNRGNPDTSRGALGGTPNNATTGLDTTAYAAMGETWSVPAAAFVEAAANPVARRGSTDFVLYMGSGYGAVGEGTTFYTLDAVTGDVVAAVDVEGAAASAGLTRSAADVTYLQADGTSLVLRNTLVANAVAFVPARFVPLQPPPPAGAKATRAYIGDTHGRLWKILSSNPGVAIPAADLGARQPSGTAVGVIALPVPVNPGDPPGVPHVYVSTGAELRADGPFQTYGFRDEGNDTDTVTVGPVPVPCPTGGCVATASSFAPVQPLFMRKFDQGTVPPSGTGLPESVFRGDVQPTSAFECIVASGRCSTPPLGRVLFGGARLNLPNTAFAPPTPMKFGTGNYPCRSSFDSILYVLGAVSGAAAYDLNASGDDAFRIFKDERLAALKIVSPPETGQTGRAVKEVGKAGGPVEAPENKGVPPSSERASASVVLKAVAGSTLPAVRFGSSVCN